MAYVGNPYSEQFDIVRDDGGMTLRRSKHRGALTIYPGLLIIVELTFVSLRGEDKHRQASRSR